MEWLLVVLFIVVAIGGYWLWERLVDGASDLLVRALVWPFAKLFGAAMTSDAMRTFRTPQRFQLSATPTRVAEVLGQLPGVTDEHGYQRIAPYYLARQAGRVRIGVGNHVVTPYELEVEFTAGWPGTCGELHYLRWSDDPSDDMDIHRELLQNVFGALGALDPALYVTTDPITIDTDTPLPTPDESPPPRAEARPGAGAPIIPAVGAMAAGSTLGRLPAIPALAAVLFVMALAVGSCSAIGIFAPTTTPELCSAYDDVRDGFSYSSSDDISDYMDKQNLGDELADLQDRADSYDDSGVEDDADNIDDFGDTVTASEFDSATTHIAALC